jgi:hypothetical protein
MALVKRPALRFVNSRAASLLAVISLWAVLYLPVLGSLELRGKKASASSRRPECSIAAIISCLYTIGLRHEPFLFYVHTPVFYVSTLEELPANVRFLLIQSRDLSKMETSARWTSWQPMLLARTALFRSNDTMLFTVTANQLNQ